MQVLFFVIGKDMHLVAMSLNTWTIARTLRKGSDDAHKHLCATEHPPRHRLPSYRKQQPCLLQSGCQAACSQHFTLACKSATCYRLMAFSRQYSDAHTQMAVTPPGGRFTVFIGLSSGTITLCRLNMLGHFVSFTIVMVNKQWSQADLQFIDHLTAY